AVDYGEQVVKIVGHTVRQPPNGFHLLNLLKQLFILDSLGDITVIANHGIDVRLVQTVDSHAFQNTPCAVFVPQPPFATNLLARILQGFLKESAQVSQVVRVHEIEDIAAYKIRAWLIAQQPDG